MKRILISVKKLIMLQDVEERDCVDNRACSWECGSVGGAFMLPMLATPSRVGTVCVHFVFTSLFKRPWNLQVLQNSAAIAANKDELLLLNAKSCCVSFVLFVVLFWC